MTKNYVITVDDFLASSEYIDIQVQILDEEDELLYDDYYSSSDPSCKLPDGVGSRPIYCWCVDGYEGGGIGLLKIFL